MVAFHERAVVCLVNLYKIIHIPVTIHPLIPPIYPTTSHPPFPPSHRTFQHEPRELNNNKKGYTQSGPLFDSKTKALTKLLTKTLSAAPHNLSPQFLFPTGPHRLRPSDIPGYVPGGEDEDPEAESENYAWFRKDDRTGAYRGLSAGLLSLAATISRSVDPSLGGDGHPVDAVWGFSQGGCVAAIVASALERPSSPAVPLSTTSANRESKDYDPDLDAASWHPALRAANLGKPLRFAVVYAGFRAPGPELAWLFGGDAGDAGEVGRGEDRKISTPAVHFVGSLDTVVEESRTEALGACWREGRLRVVSHPGGHYVPVARPWAAAVVGFVVERVKEMRDREEEEKREGEKEGGEASL